jgi:hypothetical protein
VVLASVTVPLIGEIVLHVDSEQIPSTVDSQHSGSPPAGLLDPSFTYLLGRSHKDRAACHRVSCSSGHQLH